MASIPKVHRKPIIRARKTSFDEEEYWWTNSDEEEEGASMTKPATTSNNVLPDFISNVPVYRAPQLGSWYPPFYNGDVVLDFVNYVPDGFPVSNSHLPAARMNFRLSEQSSPDQLESDREAFKKELKRLYGARHRHVNSLVYAYMVYPDDNDVSGVSPSMAIIIANIRMVQVDLVEANKRLIQSWFSFAAPALAELHEHRVQRQRTKSHVTSRSKRRLSADSKPVEVKFPASGTVEEISGKDISHGVDESIKRARSFAGLCFLGHLLLYTQLPLRRRAVKSRRSFEGRSDAVINRILLEGRSDAVINRILLGGRFDRMEADKEFASVGNFLRSGQLSWDNLVSTPFGFMTERRNRNLPLQSALDWAGVETQPFESMLSLFQEVLKGDSHIFFASMELLGRFSHQLAPPLLSCEIRGESPKRLWEHIVGNFGLEVSREYHNEVLKFSQFDRKPYHKAATFKRYRNWVRRYPSWSWASLLDEPNIQSAGDESGFRLLSLAAHKLLTRGSSGDVLKEHEYTKKEPYDGDVELIPGVTANFADSRAPYEQESMDTMNIAQPGDSDASGLVDVDNDPILDQLLIGGNDSTRVKLEKLDECHKPSRLDNFRLMIERKVGEKLDWSPFPPIDCHATSAEKRLVWEYGGRILTIYFGPNYINPCPETTADAEAGSLPTTNLLPTASQNASNLVGALFKYWQTFRQRATLAMQKWKRDDTSSVLNAVAESPPQQDDEDGKESPFCVDEHRKSVRSTSMHTVSFIDTFKNDRQLYLALRKTLEAGKGSWLRSLGSWKTCTELQLCKFTILFDNYNLVHVSGRKVSTSVRDVLCDNYEYPSFTDSDDLENFMMVMAETILQGLKNPDLGLNERFVLDGLPKLKSPPGISKERGKSGCGFHAIQGYSLMKVLFWIGVMLSPGLAFIVVWLSVVGALDLQSAFVPITFLSGLIAMVLGICMMLGL